MANYMYNPSRKVTELLSEYLEFDPEQLKLGIWSGHLSATSVALREDAVDPLLAALGRTVGGGLRSGPPLRFKLVSGTIGNLEMTIPWTRLVWGQGDVQVDVKNVTIILAVESVDESQARTVRGRKLKDEKDNESMNKVGKEGGNVLFPEMLIDEDDTPSINLIPQAHQGFMRDLKQSRLREAERRQLHGLSIGAWISSVNKRDKHTLDALLAKNEPLANVSSRFGAWLQNATRDFFWRFHNGLAMKIDNLEVVIAQDGVEVGLMIPSARMIADGTRVGRLNKENSARQTDVNEAEPVIDQGEHKDGEHVDKVINISGIGIYVRQVSRNRIPTKVMGPISANEYVLRPVDLTFKYSIFYPYPQDKQKPSQAPAIVHSESGMPNSSLINGSHDESVSVVPTKRRGKRDRAMSQSMDDSAFMDYSPSRNGSTGPRYSSAANDEMTIATSSLSGGIRTSETSKSPVMHLSSDIHGTSQGFETSSAEFQLREGKNRENVSSFSRLPLIQAEDLQQAYVAMTGPSDTSPSITVNVTLGAIETVLSSTHYRFLRALSASCSKLRYGRPSMTIGEALLDANNIQIEDASDDNTDQKPFLLNHGSLAEHSAQDCSNHDADMLLLLEKKRRTLRLWWKYALRVIVWELRQRRLSRKQFQRLFLLFDWNKQQYKRKDYIKLYISVYLNRHNAHGETETVDTTTLLDIEDELCIEQILLYRTLARKIYMQGYLQMPDSILEICEREESIPSFNGDRGSRRDGQLSMKVSRRVPDDTNFLHWIEKQGDIARKRCKANSFSVLESYDAILSPALMYSTTPSVIDEGTYAYTMDSQSVARKVFELQKTLSSDNLEERGMRLSFSFCIEKLEVMVVEEDAQLQSNIAGNLSNIDLSASDASSTEVSVLTDDQRFFTDNDEGHLAVHRENEDDVSVFIPTDYLRCNETRNLLHVEVTSVTGSVDTSGSGLRNFNVRIHRICARGVEKTCLFRLSSAKDESLNSLDHPLSQASGSEALVVSSIMSQSERIFQCDSDLVTMVLHWESFDKIWNFYHSYSVFSKKLITLSETDKARQCVMEQTSTSRFRRLNCSIRVRGMEIQAPRAEVANTMESAIGSYNSTSRDSGMILQASIIEVYSGSAVSALHCKRSNFDSQEDTFEGSVTVGDSEQTVTRVLHMLQLEQRMVLQPSPVSHNWVVTVSHLDCLVQCKNHSGYETKSLMELPLEIEILFLENFSFVGEKNHAEYEVSVELSALHLILSRDRVEGLSQLWPKAISHKNKLDTEAEHTSFLLPRIDLLSHLLIYSVGIHVEKIKVYLARSQEQDTHATVFEAEKQLEPVLSCFLHIASTFDKSFPHEEALASAMQLCIDQLSGLGLHAEDGWEITNRALLIFLEKAPAGATSHSSFPGSPYKVYGEESPIETTDALIRKSVEETLASFPRLVETCHYSKDKAIADFMLELPFGISCSFVRTFYDVFAMIQVASLSVSNSLGTHLLRVTGESSSKTVIDTNDAGTGKSQSQYDGQSRSFINSPHQYGIQWQLFIMDVDQLFGTGGVPLKVIAADVNTSELPSREQECLQDLEVGDIEVLCSPLLLSDVGLVVSDILGPLVKQRSALNDNTSTINMKESSAIKFEFLCSLSSISVLFVAHDLVPFSRMTTEGCLVKSQHHRSEDQCCKQWFISCQSVLLGNLSKGGELYPEPITSSSENMRTALEVVMISSEWATSISVKSWDLQICFLQQYLSECNQYLLSEKHGIVPILKQSICFLQSTQVRPKKRTHFFCEMLDTSLLLPRLSSSSDMVAFELDSIRIMFYLTSSSFSMPTQTSVLQRFDSSKPGIQVDNNCVFGKGGKISGSISRVELECKGLELYTTIGTRDKHYSSSENAAFRFFYLLNGRARAHKKAFMLRESMASMESAASFLCQDNRPLQYWERATVSPVDLDILIDRAPHVRILVTEPVDAPTNALDLEISLSQWCLLLSIWFSNIQELPIQFPYPMSLLKSAALPTYTNFSLPEFGTLEFQHFVSTLKEFRSEFCVKIRYIGLHCIADEYHNILKGTNLENLLGGIKVSFWNPVLHVANDTRGISYVGWGSTRAQFVDGSKTFDTVLSFPDEQACPEWAWADVTFGLCNNYQLLNSKLPQLFQLSICLTPKWTIYNLGIMDGTSNLSEFSSIFCLLEFISSYFSDTALGNPSIDAVMRNQNMKIQLARCLATDIDEVWDLPGTNVDFRLWLVQPCLSLPCDPADLETSGVRMIADGLWYRYSSMRTYTEQEIVAKNLRLFFDDHFIASAQGNMSNNSRCLVDDLSFCLHLDYNYLTKHSGYEIQVPFDDVSSCSLVSPSIAVHPLQLAPEKICVPFVQPERYLGKGICDITLVLEIIPLVSSAILRLLNRSKDEADKDSHADEDGNISSVADEDSKISNNHSATEPGSSDNIESSFSFVAKIASVRIFALDPVLGLHLPVAVVSVSSVDIMASKFSGLGSVTGSPILPRDDLNLAVETLFWADYFKLGQTRSWEPLLEPYGCTVLFQKSLHLGTGVNLSSDAPFHLNISGALLVIIDEVLDSFRLLINQQWHGSMGSENGKLGAHLVFENKDMIEESLGPSRVLHELPTGLKDDDRVAFSIKNMTGQKIRIRKPNTGPAHSDTDSVLTVLSYLNHTKSTQLLFRPSISVIKNMKIADVDFPGLPKKGLTDYEQKDVPKHTVDLQVPGFHWLEDIEVDSFGRSFVNMIPRHPDLRTKTASDWRLGNIFQLLVEVGLQNGGRQVTVKSLFSIVNQTSHKIDLILHPNPAYKPEKSNLLGPLESRGGEIVEDAVIAPGDSFQVPALLAETSLRQPGSHIGCMWLRPNASEFSDESTLKPFLYDHEAREEISVSFSSRPLQFARVVSESALLFEGNYGKDMMQQEVQTGVQVSCPVMMGSAERLSPFCYAIEVTRSPLVKAPPTHGTKDRMHGPVAYTLSIYPTFIIANLLPKRGRFELMHAIHRTVVWFADLDPGQIMSIHSVGLDAPLLLLINLGFCRTPVGEGALVHHGSDQPRGAVKEGLAGLKSIGKAGKAVTKQLGRTLVKIGDSPDKRGHEKMFLVQNPQFFARKLKEKDAKTHIDATATTDLGLDADAAYTANTGGKTYRTNTAMFFPQDVAVETTVIDGLGQRLKLNIENIRGGGGQRQISVFTPFWIVNTTEHSLRYKQEKSNFFVAGTVSSRTCDGSKPLSGGRGHIENKSSIDQAQTQVNEQRNEGTIFSGTPGALAASPGQCELSANEVAPLVASNLPITKLAELAFMFNFSEGVLSLGHQKICVQLWDGTGITEYVSDWSQGLSLDSVGFSQTVSMHCHDGRNLEVTMVVTVAPGILSGYTKIIRFLPRYLLVNATTFPIRIWQDSSIFRPPAADNSIDSITKERRWQLTKEKKKRNPHKVNQYEALWGHETLLDERYSGPISPTTRAHPSALYVTTVGPSEIIPFNLPDSRAERLLRVDLGGEHNLTASFSADVPGEHTLKVTRAIDLKLLPHVLTRASPEYEICFPPSDIYRVTSELGLWFETEWGSEKNLIVKAIKRDSFAFTETDVHIGDELLSIDGVSVSHMTFSEAMNKIRTRVTELTERSNSMHPRATLRRASLRLVGSAVGLGRSMNNAVLDTGLLPLLLRFRTVEDRLRRLRVKASVSNAVKASTNQSFRTASAPNTFADNGNDSMNTDISFIRAEMKSLQSSLFLVVREESSLPYRIENRSMASTIYYRQKGCPGHPWQFLKPGQTRIYAWEEPLKPKRLSVRVGMRSDLTNKSPSYNHSHEKRTWTPFFRYVRDEEDAVFSAPVSVRLEEIGFKETLTCPGSAADTVQVFDLAVEVSGATRVLTVQDASLDGNETQLVNQLQSLESLERKEESRCMRLNELHTKLQRYPDKAGSNSVVEEAQKLMADFPEDPVVSRCHQLIVQVIEANGLSSGTFAGSCNPYAEVFLINGGHNRCNVVRRRKLYRTYYIKKTVNPTWNSQTFIFDVPPEAVDTPRGYCLNIRLRNFRRFGQQKTLGKAQIELHSLRDQKPITGWFPLAGRTGRHELENALSHWGRGSVRVGIHWIHSSMALVEYFILLSEKRLHDLNISLQGMKQQISNRKAIKEQKQGEFDGFSRVRVHDLVSFSAQMRRTKRLNSALLPKSKAKDLKTQLNREAMRNKQPSTLHSLSIQLLDSPQKAIATRRRRDLKRTVEEFIKEKVKEEQRLSLDPIRLYEDTSVSVLPRCLNGAIVIEGFRFWSASSALFQDCDLTIHDDSLGVTVKLSETRPAKRSQLSMAFDRSEPVGARLCLPAVAPSSMIFHRVKHASLIQRSRIFFDRAVRRKNESVLHPGGWLMIRPYAALNLPDSYHGMFVKTTFGPETLVTETVDAKVSPVWHDLSAAFDESYSYGPNDMLIHIPPRKTSGLIRLSVVGEKSHPNLSAKVELGVLYLPLGRVIAACLDSMTETNSTIPVYTRWFPLVDPKEIVPVEGDCGLSARPTESEKISDNMFKEYFAACIQLSIFWFPDENDFNVRDDQGFQFSDSESLNTSLDASIVPERSASDKRASRKELNVATYLYADIGRVSLALIDSQRAYELLSFTASDIDIRYWTTRAKTRYGISIGWLQIDQQDDNAREPVVLAPTPMDYIGPVIQGLAVKDNVRSVAGVVSIDFIDVSIAEFDLTIEESMLFDIFDFVKSVRLRRGFLVAACGVADETSTMKRSVAGTQSVFKEADDIAHGDSILSLLRADAYAGWENDAKVYIEQLFLGVIKVNLSYLKGKKQMWEFTGQGGSLERRSLRQNSLMNTGASESSSSLLQGRSDALTNWAQHTSDEDFHSEGIGKLSLPQLLASLFPNVSDAPIKLQGKALNHVFERPSEILQSIRKFYVNETLRQIYRIIGSLDFVGNPTMLFSSFMSGIRDLVMTPSQAFMRSPTDASGVGLGVATGTLSLFSNCASGFFGFGAKVTAAAGHGIAWITLDEDYRIWHRDKIVTEVTNLSREWKRRGVQTVKAMVARLVADVFFGVAFGVTGIVVAPIKGYRRDGSFGLLKGTVSGLIGIVTKPLVGVLDALTHFSASIHDIAKSVNILDKRQQPALKLRLPYIFGLMHILAPYETKAVQACSLLKRYPIKKSMTKHLRYGEVIIHVEVLPNVAGDTYMILTSFRVIVIRVRKDASGSLVTSLCWEVSLVRNTLVSSKLSEHGHNGVALTLTITKMREEEQGSKLVSFDMANETGTDEKDFGNQTVIELPSDPDALANQFGVTFGLDGREGQFHGTGTGEKGELLEWFTVLTEDDNRAQMARLHNAISCCAGQFDAVVFDPSLGRPASAQGYTSFGMYQFAPDSKHQKFSVEESGIDRKSILDEIPWIDEETFNRLKDKSPSVQKVILAEKRRMISLLTEIETSKKEGGPDWLVHARAQALYDQDTSPSRMNSPSDEAMDDVSALDGMSSTSQTGKSRFSKLKKWAASPLTSIPDYGILETGTDMIPFLRKRDRRKKKSKSEPDLAYGESPERSTMISHQYHSADLHDSSTPGSHSEKQLLLWKAEESEEKHESSLSARQTLKFTDSAIREPSGKVLDLSPHHSQGPDSISESPVIHMQTTVPASDLDKKALVPGDLKQKDLVPGGGSIINDSLALQVPEQPLGRLDRMEKLMEYLLVLTSEQALKPKAHDSGSGSRVELELANIREELKSQYTKNQISENEINALREEISQLRAEVMKEKKLPKTGENTE